MMGAMRINRPIVLCDGARKLLLSALLLLLAPSDILAEEPGPPSSPAPLHRIDAKTPAGLQDLFRRTAEPLPLVSAHRGGPQAGFPENCIPTFENTLRHTYAILEIDPRLTKDGQIVIHHDATLERTTTGRGRVADHTLAELKELRLKDPAGNVTEYQIPTLDEVLEWARGKTILVLDQKDVSVAARVKKIEEHKAEAYAMLIVYSFKEVQTCYELKPKVMMEVMIPSRAKLAEFQKLGVPWRNIVAFVGHEPPEDAALYEAIHAEGTCCLIGTSRNLDRQVITGETTEIQELKPAYRAFLDRGADIIETDIPTQLGPLLYKQAAVPAAKKQFCSLK
jgi:glycerophosphoryl diester phosphodiesterase